MEYKGFNIVEKDGSFEVVNASKKVIKSLKTLGGAKRSITAMVKKVKTEIEKVEEVKTEIEKVEEVKTEKVKTEKVILTYNDQGGYDVSDYVKSYIEYKLNEHDENEPLELQINECTLRIYKGEYSFKDNDNRTFKCTYERLIELASFHIGIYEMKLERAFEVSSIPFGGFYNSYADLVIDMDIENEISYIWDEIGDDSIEIDDINDSFMNCINWDKARIDYSIKYCELIESLLIEYMEWNNYNVFDSVNIDFLRLYSPKFYNYETDAIYCTFSYKTIEIIKWMLFNSELSIVDTYKSLCKYEYEHDDFDMKTFILALMKEKLDDIGCYTDDASILNDYERLILDDIEFYISEYINIDAIENPIIKALYK